MYVFSSTRKTKSEKKKKKSNFHRTKDSRLLVHDNVTIQNQSYKVSFLPFFSPPPLLVAFLSRGRETSGR